MRTSLWIFTSACLLGVTACSGQEPGTAGALDARPGRDGSRLLAGMAPYDFETDSQGWSVENSAGTTQQVGPASGAILGPSYTGSGALYWQVGAGSSNNLQVVNRNTSASLALGSTLSMYIWVGDHTGFSKITPFMQNGSSYAFSGLDIDSTNGLPDHDWVQALLPVPTSNGPVVGIGLYIDCSSNCSGDIYIDNVTQM